ncbi:MAG TPA: ABC transporter ATP-binding protein [Patescibacteria group bacterium]|nr:ABC transporter ATP-binding protein [Patescibacteria group bacterium]
MRENVGIQTVDLSKQYPGTDYFALRDLSIQVKRGEVYGFLGANGAGKTTTIRLLLNFLQPSRGSAVVLGLDVVDDSVEIKRHVGYLSGDVALYPKATGREFLDYLGRLQGMKSQGYRKKLEQRFEADLDKPISSLSKGNRQKLGVLQALMHEPDVLVLDEPTSGLDPLMQEAFYDSLREAKSRGAAVFMSSHNLAEAQRVCDRVGIIKAGRLLREQAVQDDADLGGTVLRVRFKSPEVIGKVKRASAVKVVSQEDERTLLVQPARSIASALKALSQYDIEEFSSQSLDLESEFIEFYGENG